MFLDFQKNVKNVKNVRIIFHGCLMFIVPVHGCQNLSEYAPELISLVAFVICSDSAQPQCSAMTPNGSHSPIWELNHSDH